VKKRITKTCKKHGDTLHILESKNYYRCKECKRSRRQAHRKKTKKDLVELFGGACQVCGYNNCHEALQFHHLDHTTKSFGLNRTEYSRAYSVLVDEAKKCALLCANCHAEVHAGELKLKDFKVGYSSG
jgi:hypothetical protein